MTFVHWVQTIWTVSMLVVFAQIYWLERTRRKLLKQIEQLELIQHAYSEWRKLWTGGEVKGFSIDVTSRQTGGFDA